MSGDVQPRKRKDKKKKRDSLDRRSEGEIFTRKFSLKDDEEVKESHHGVNVTKMGSDDVLLHVQSDHGTGGHWCAKIFFFSLLAILFGLVGLIIMENRGLSDLDTPLSESRFSEYFEGWVDEHRPHDDHHDIKTGLEDQEHDAGPFEEEDDHSEQEEDDAHDVGDKDDHDEEDDVEHEDEADNTAEDDDDNETVEETDKNEDDEDEKEEADNEDDDEKDDEEDEEENNTAEEHARNKRDIEEGADDNNDEGFEDDDNAEENDDGKDDDPVDDPIDEGNDDDDAQDDNEAESTTQRAVDDDAPFEESKTNQEQKNIEKNTNNVIRNSEKESINTETKSDTNQEQNTKKTIRNSKKEAMSTDTKEIPIDDKTKEDFMTSKNENDASKVDTGNLKSTTPADAQVTENVVHSPRIKEDDDFFENDESLEQVVENDAGEMLHLRQKAEQEEMAARAAEIQEEEESNSAPLAVKIVVGLALALVARLVLVKKTKPAKADEPVQGSPHMRRRFTMIAADDNIPVENEELIDEELDEEEYLEEEEEDEEDDEQLKYSDDEEEGGINVEKFAPETFEELNAMYRPKPPVVESGVQEIATRKVIEEVAPPKVPESIPSVAAQTVREEPRRIVFDDTPKVNLVDEYNVRPDDYDEEEGQDEHDVDEEISEEDDGEIYSGSEEDADEEEISDVDDDELMKRLEEKYGKLPAKQFESDEEDAEEPSWTKIRPNARGPQSYRNDDEYIDEEIRRANEELFNDNLKSALNIYESLVLQYPEHPGALYGKAKVLDRLSDKYKSNQMLNDAIESYRALLALDEKVEDEVYRHAAEQCLDRMKFRGMHVQSLPLHRKLIRRFSNEPKYRNQLAVTYLLLNRLSDAKYVLHHTLIRWRDNGFAQAHYGFILKVHDNDLKGAVILLREGIASGAEGTQDGRFYFSLGDALYRLGEKDEAREVYRKGAALNLYPSEYQRSLYNVKGLKAQPFWTKEETTYEKELTVLERNWELIRKEAMSALNSEGYFEDETESLRDTGDWKQLELFARGRKIAKNCIKTPLTCSIIETFTAARSCRRGQVKFSVMHSGTHVWAHCGPTNCRLRAHLGLTVPANTTLRVATEERTWKEGEFLIFDDSFEHEVWHNGTSLRLVLIVDVWHPELTEEQRDKLSPI